MTCFRRGLHVANSAVRIWAAVAFLILFSVASNVKMLKDTTPTYHVSPGQDGISLYEARFQGLKKTLPDSVQVLCYFSPDPQNVRDFYLAQYALAPMVLIRNDECQ